MNAEFKAKLIDRVKHIEGLTDEQRSALLELLRTNKPYGLVWENKPEAVEERLRNELPLLIEDKSKALTDGGDDAPNHILIEGDNLEALTTLAYTHAGKIDVIYIDPPYNTGNKDFIYNDSYVDSEDSYRHSKWLSFMNKRLRIAKKLLSDRGVIFISIDDNEQANLKLLCDEILGERNFISTLPRVTKKSGKDHSDNIAKNHDFVLIYAKDISVAIFNGIKTEETGYDNVDEYVATRGKYKLNQTLDYNSLWYNPAMDFPIEINGVTYYAGGDKTAHDLRHNGVHDPKDWVWRWSQTKFDFGLEHGFVVFKKSRNGVRIYTKTYLNASISKKGNEYFIEYKERETKMGSLTFTNNIFSNDNAKKDIEPIIGGNAFDFPKPVSLIKQILEICSFNDSTILDFFAGSGTTMHAVMQLNAEDGGHRQCILVTNNENGICENVTYERNKRVINGYTKPNGEAVEGLHANNLRYYRTAFVGRDRSPKNLRELVALSTDMLCIKEDLYHEVAMFAGQKTHPSAFRYFEQGDKRMMVIYREEYVPAIVELIDQYDLPQGDRIKVYVFSPSEDPWAGEFEVVEEKVSLCALPMAILNAYKRVLPKRRDRNIFVEDEEETKQNDSLFPEMEEGGAQ